VVCEVDSNDANLRSIMVKARRVRQSYGAMAINFGMALSMPAVRAALGRLAGYNGDARAGSTAVSESGMFNGETTTTKQE
jgi:hypothetical protein